MKSEDYSYNGFEISLMQINEDLWQWIVSDSSLTMIADNLNTDGESYDACVRAAETFADRAGGGDEEITVSLSPELHAALSAIALSANLSVDELAKNILQTYLMEKNDAAE